MSTFTYLHYTLTIHSPAIVTTLSGDPNSAATQAFIPGGTLRGATAARLIAAGSNGQSELFRTLILSGSVRYLHAYPEIAGARALPIPTSWKCDKDERNEARDLGCFSGRIPETDTAEDTFERCWPERVSTSPERPFVSSSGGMRIIDAPRRDARLHQQMDRKKGRPWKDQKETTHGAIFAYEYLEPEQTFRGVIQVENAAASHIERIKNLFTDTILLGRSRRAGYGGEASIRFCPHSKREWEIPNTASNIQAGQGFRALLTSAYIGRHPETGQIDPAALEHELRRRLNGAASVERLRWSFEVIGGFNQKWRLELPQAHAAAGGASLVLQASEAIPPDVLRQIEHEGLGERRTEGFGRVLFLQHREDASLFSLRKAEAPSSEGGSAQPPALDTLHVQQIEMLETRILLVAARAELDRVAADIAGQIARARIHIPTNSLLARLRTAFRNVRDEKTAREALAMLGTWCGNEGSEILKASARDQLDRCMVRGSTLRLWLHNFGATNKARDPWETLLEASRPSTLSGLTTKRRLTDVNTAQAILRAHADELNVYLIDAVLAALAKISRREAR